VGKTFVFIVSNKFSWHNTIWGAQKVYAVALLLNAPHGHRPEQDMPEEVGNT